MAVRNVFSLWRLIVFAGLIAGTCTGQLKVGDSCTISRSKETGRCQLFERCPGARQAVAEGRRVSACEYVVRVRPQTLVCCVQEDPAPISELKCEEYNQQILRLAGTEEEAGPGQCPYRKAVTGYVIGGQEVDPAEFPFMAALGSRIETDRPEWRCGGTLVSDRHVLTAAHCVYHWGNVVSDVRLGAHNLNQEEENAEDYGVANYTIHPSYSKNKNKHFDIAVLQLDRPVRFSKYIRPACISWKKNFEKVLATGWGITARNGPKSSVLMKVVLQSVEESVCGEQLPEIQLIPQQMCASGDQGRDTCQGDSGGPLVLPGGSCTDYVVGTTSFGRSCATGLPGVYTRVAALAPWIEAVVWP